MGRGNESFPVKESSERSYANAENREVFRVEPATIIQANGSKEGNKNRVCGF